jgi:flavin-dependent dehydrogenase
MYLIKRGNEEDSLDSSLERQAGEEGVVIVHHSKLQKNEADIIATGIREPAFIAMGIKFKFVHPDRTVVLFDDRLSLKMYSYLIVNDQMGEIVCVNPVGIKDHRERLAKTIKRFEEILKISIDKPLWRFSAPGSFDYMDQAAVNNQLFVGEAAGFQDSLAGFGMIYAFKSGYYAAKSILEGQDYDALWKKDFLKPMAVSSKNRALFEKLSNKGYDRCIMLMNSKNVVIKLILGGKDIRKILKRTYNHAFPPLLRLFIRRHI